jgi:hypothetical protein
MGFHPHPNHTLSILVTVLPIKEREFGGHSGYDHPRLTHYFRYIANLARLNRERRQVACVIRNADLLAPDGAGLARLRPQCAGQPHPRLGERIPIGGPLACVFPHR